MASGIETTRVRESERNEADEKKITVTNYIHTENVRRAFKKQQQQQQKNNIREDKNRTGKRLKRDERKEKEQTRRKHSNTCHCEG